MRKLNLLFAIVVFAQPASALAQKEPPYWASIDEPEARMRTGPSTEYPTMWIYKRERLPLKILARYKAWRKVEDPEGVQGWMHVRLLSAAQTALVTGEEIVNLRAQPRGNARITWRVEPGVVGSISQCQNGWCLFDIRGRQGYVNTDMIWGDEPLK